MKNYLFSNFIICNFLICSILSGQKIKVNTIVDGTQREYFLHIPSSYKANSPVPLVFMLHGTSGNGEEFYDKSGWTELSEQEGFIAVFPSSMRYKIIDNGELKNTTKWNTTPDADWTFQPGEQSKDDIKFLKKVIQEIESSYTIDLKRVYLNGFSNGGSMAAKCSIEMSDLLAAVCSNAGSFFLDTVYTPIRKTPYLYQVGNRDYGPGNVGPEFPEIPMSLFDTIISTPGLSYLDGKHYRIANNSVRNFSLKSEHSAIIGDTNFAVLTTYYPIDPIKNHEFRYVLVKDLGHSYPNWAPTEHWKWLKRFTLDNITSGGNTLTTNEGYGSGQYEKGKKIHIWSKQIDGKVFTHWTGDIQYLSTPIEYHSIVTMPDKDIAITANYANLTQSMQMLPVSIKGAEKNKNIYVYVPTDKNKVNGVVWFFHGTNGNALSLISDPDTKQMINLLMVNNYAIVALTSEESELNIDFDNDGFYRWSYGIDSTLIDIANVRAIRDSMINRGFILSSTSHSAIGWSAGGAFTEFISNSLAWKAAINHTSSGSESLSKNSLIKVPYLVSINENDNNPGVGPQGNANARMNIMNYLNRGACARLHEQLEAPLFAERFDRSNLISEELSKQIFNEIKINNGLDSNNFLRNAPNQLALAIAMNPSKFPVILGLTLAQRDEVLKQLEVTYADHSLKADINGMSLNFIEEACGAGTSTKNLENLNTIIAFPNPVHDILNLNEAIDWSLYNIQGVLLESGRNNKINMSKYSNGIYLLRIDAVMIKIIKD
jgi:poly(3-hydroxybutyrate) depolymerase